MPRTQFARIVEQFATALHELGITAPQSAVVDLGDEYLEIVFGKGRPPIRDRTSKLTRCQAVCLELFEEVVPIGERRTAKQVRVSLLECGSRYSEALIRKSLSQLAHDGHLRNARNREGYWLPGESAVLFG